MRNLLTIGSLSNYPLQSDRLKRVVELHIANQLFFFLGKRWIDPLSQLFLGVITQCSCLRKRHCWIDTESQTILFSIEAIFHSPVSGTRGNNLKIQTSTICQLIGFLSGFSRVYLSRIKFHWGHLPGPNTECPHLCPQ